jgi:hypothetical protein
VLLVEVRVGGVERPGLILVWVLSLWRFERRLTSTGMGRLGKASHRVRECKSIVHEDTLEWHSRGLCSLSRFSLLTRE